MIKPEAIPQYTGNLPQLEREHAALKKDAAKIRETGSDIHSQFQGLSAYYKAPEAEQLFASTKPVKDRADGFAEDLETVSSALADYAREIRPLVKKLEELKVKAQNFVSENADDDEWQYDGDKVDEHNALRDEITATVAAFWAAERTCHNKITALWGGAQMVAGDGSDRNDQYGFNADDMKNAKVPWGDPVEEKHHWYEAGHWVKSFVWDGLIVDGVWGTVKGLGTLVGFNGWDSMKQAWKGLAQLGTGLAMSAGPGAVAFWATPEDKLPSWLRESRTAMKETGKSLVAWDEWGRNPGRAAGATTFNVVTTVLTGGAGGAASGAGKAGAVARTLSAAGKAGRVIDPMTYIAKGAGTGLAKVGDITKGLRGVGNIDVPGVPDEAITLPEGSVRLSDGAVRLPEGAQIPEGAVRLDDGSVRLPEGVPALPEGTVKLPTEAGAPAQYLDPDGNILDGSGEVVRHTDLAPRDVVGRPGDDAPASAAEPPRAEAEVPAREPALVGPGANRVEGAADLGRAGDDVAGHGPGGVADDLPTARVGNDTISSGARTPGDVGGGLPGGGSADELGRSSSGGGDLPGERGGDALPGGGHGDLPPGTGGSGDLSRFGDDPPARPDHPGYERQPGVDDAAYQRQVREHQVWRANNDPGFFREFYQANGHRKNLDLVDESGLTPPQLTRESPNHPWIAAKDAPPPLKPDYLDDAVVRGRENVSPEALKTLDDAAARRHHSIAYDQAAGRHRADAIDAHRASPTVENDLTRIERGNEYKSAHRDMRDYAEEYGEAIAEHHVIPERYPNATRETLHGPRNGNDQFDQVWRREDGGFVVVEAKSSVDTELGARNLPSGKRVSQGTREYFLDIIREMQKRGEHSPSERRLARELRRALDAGKLDYIVVKGQRNAGEYAGYSMRQFDIADRSAR